jgi:hypothetical protein
MTVLEKAARNQLDKAVQAARRTATIGADRALRALAVEQEKKPAHLTSSQGELRRQLRVVCRRLGSWDALIRAAAYEHWHRMLFARFLAENKLLIHPQYLAHVTLDDCAQLARERGSDQWEIAAEFAAGMLPGIFQKDDPLLLIKFAPEDRAALQEILRSISPETFHAEDALGWTYQFWQSEEKEKVNKSEKKIEGYDICAVTQLFTEPYMVQFLLQNTLGAWWLHLHPASPLRKEWVYFKDQVQHDFSAFPTSTKDLKLLDPACGSGHFLIAAFHMLLAMRLEEGQEKTEAVREIVRDNLHGLELEPRCIQIAGFAVAMEAWKSGFPTDQYLPLPNLACTGLPIRAEKSEWLKLAAGDGLLEGELNKYYNLFKNADSLGSLIQINEEGTLIPGDVLMKKLETALAKEKTIGDPVAEAFGETASGILKAVSYLRRNDFHIVVTNPPFLGKGKFSNFLKAYCDDHYPDEIVNLATCFVKRSKFFVKHSNYYALVTPQNWFFQPTYRKMRVNVLKSQKIHAAIKIGANAFETISGEIVQIALLIFSNAIPQKNSEFIGLDVSKFNEPGVISQGIIDESPSLFNQLSQLKNPDELLIIGHFEKMNIFGDYVTIPQGLKTGDDGRYRREFWEIPDLKNSSWRYYQSTPDKIGAAYSGMHFLIDWKNEGRDLARLQGFSAWGNKGVALAKMDKLPASLYLGDIQDSNIYIALPNDSENLAAIWYFLISDTFIKTCRTLNPSLDLPISTIGNVPFDLAHWQKVADEMGPLPEPCSNDPTQWLFKGNIVDNEQPLHVAIARMLGYRWPEQPASDDPIEVFVDKDGIVCVPPVWGERPAFDVLRSILAVAYESEWSPRKEEELLKQAGYSKSGGLEGFLRDEFFKSHCALFQQRPFIWQIWDGTRDGFSALINYHKLDRNTLQKLIYTYLGNWITQQKDEVRQEKPGAERRLAAAEDLKKNLEKILEGEKPFDIYVRWKPLNKQAIGWEPDLNDGVRMNIRPFIEAGVLRWTPNIKWGKDRGTDPVPNCSGTTERLNDRHFSLDEKRRAKEESK